MLKQRALWGVFWSFLERAGTSCVTFVVTIVLARLLTPADYGAIGMLSVFICVSQALVECGFSSALIQKQNRDEADYATVFWCNLGISFICYGLLWISSGLIADFYKMPILQSVLKIYGISIVIGALFAVQVARLTALLDFKTQAKVSLIRSILSGLVGVSLAYYGYGVWALVGQAVSSNIIAMILYLIFTRWIPAFSFSRQSFQSLFGFGSRLMAANLLGVVYNNVAPLIIGRKFTAEDLGYYSRGCSLAGLPGGIIEGIFSKVLFPVLSSIQDDEARLKRTYNRYLKLVTSIVAPLMLCFAAIAKPLVVLLIGEKWLPCVPYLQLLAIGWMIDPIVSVNLIVLYVKGKTDVVLKLEIIKKIIAIVIVVLSVHFGIIWLCVGRVVYGFVALFLNLHFCAPYIGMGIARQIREVASIYSSSIFVAICTWIVASLFWESESYGMIVRSATSCMAGAFVGGVVFIALGWLLKFELVQSVCGFLRARCTKGIV